MYIVRMNSNQDKSVLGCFVSESAAIRERERLRVAYANRLWVRSLKIEEIHPIG